MSKATISIEFAEPYGADALSVIQHLLETFNDDGSILSIRDETGLRDLVEKVAATGYDGRPCSHQDDCHDLSDDCDGEPWTEACQRGEHCSDWSVSNDEEHDNLVALVSEARELLGLPDLYQS